MMRSFVAFVVTNRFFNIASVSHRHSQDGRSAAESAQFPRLSCADSRWCLCAVTASPYQTPIPTTDCCSSALGFLRAIGIQIRGHCFS
jgi:hypothetical protein